MEKNNIGIVTLCEIYVPRILTEFMPWITFFGIGKVHE